MVDSQIFPATFAQGRAFEREVARIFRVLGLEVLHDVALAGMQIDLVTKERTASGTLITSAIECKAYTRPVGVDIVVQFSSVIRILRDQALVDRGIIVALSGFTRQAREAARSSKIDLIEFDDLRQRISNVSAAALEKAKLAVETEERVSEQTHQRRVFVIMPFDEEFEDVYILGIRAVAENLGFVVERADNIEHNVSILQVIQEHIRDADAIIADATRRNPNVFYEIGYAHALGKSTILIARKSEILPFDIQSMNIIFYESIVTLRQRLEHRIKGTILTR